MPYKRLIAAFLLLILHTPVRSGEHFFDFNSGLPAQHILTLDAFWSPTGGVGNSGVIKLTTAAPRKQGWLELPILDGGALIESFTMDLKLYVGGGTSTPADGFLVHFTPGAGEGDGIIPAGEGDGIIFRFDTFNNGGDGPAVHIWWKNTVLVRNFMQISQGPGGNQFFDLHIKVDADGTADVVYNGITIYDNQATPFVPQAGARFMFRALNGSLYDNHWMDDLRIVTVPVTLTEFQSWYDSYHPGQGYEADPDGDDNRNGVSNFSEFAFAMDLLSGKPAGNLLQAVSRNQLTYRRPKGKAITYALERKTSALDTTWSTAVLTQHYTEVVVDEGATELVQLNLTPSPIARTFYRIRATAVAAP